MLSAVGTQLTGMRSGACIQTVKVSALLLCKVLGGGIHSRAAYEHAAELQMTVHTKHSIQLL